MQAFILDRMEIEINLYLEINLILLLFVITCQSKLGCTKQWAGLTVVKYEGTEKMLHHHICASKDA